MSNSRPILPTLEELAVLPSDGGAGWNRLVFEKSPYLLQHAANPVDWWPWGDAAFEAARAQNKPVFLSIGYSTCHWCHVMEHESFEDAGVAALLNEHFIPIKVDREERPDIDQVYMTVTIAYTGQGGWPMTVLLTPDRKPFFAGTYFPRDGRHGRPGMKELVPYFSDLWKSDREKVQGAADELTGELARMTTSFPGGELGTETLDLAFEQLEERFDEVFGGFSGRHKFPTPHNFIFLVRYWERTGSARALEIVTKTLRAMRLGGIFDQVGFGFHRYSTDERWLLPHFEKMLYDQALMVLALVEAHQATGDESLARTARETLTYVLRDMTAPEGGFYSAEDADSEGEEGRFTVWSAEEVDTVLGAEEGALFRDLFHFEEGGNFREESTGQKQGVNIPHLRATLEEEAVARGMAVGALRDRVEAMRARLFEVREARLHPLKDDKILTDWNGLMIAAMARAGRALAAPEYTSAARRAADFVLAHLRTPEGRLLKRHRGEAGLPAHLDDYAFMVYGLLELYQATFEVRFLREARGLAETMLDLFHDGEAGGFFLTARDGEALIVRPKESYDGAIPSGNSVAALALLWLGRMTGEARFEEVARGVLEAFSAPLEKAPSNFTFALLALDFDLGPSEEIVLAGELDAVAPMRAHLDRAHLPRAVVLHRPSDAAGAQEVVDLVPFLEHQMPLNGKATAYLCRNYACESPVTDAGELARRLEARKSTAEREKGSST